MTATETLTAVLALGAAIRIFQAARQMELSESEIEKVAFLVVGLLKLARPLLREVAP
jgi:hypothetical protein